MNQDEAEARSYFSTGQAPRRIRERNRSVKKTVTVELPEPYEDTPIVKRPYWVGYKPGAFTAYAQADGVWLETDAKYRALTPAQARSCAAALLAAAERVATPPTPWHPTRRN